MGNIVRDEARKELRRRDWASMRGKATRAYLRSHPELTKQFELEGTVIGVMNLPRYVTRASIILELNQRAKRREASRSAREWIRAHPDEAAKVAAVVRAEGLQKDVSIE